MRKLVFVIILIFSALKSQEYKRLAVYFDEFNDEDEERTAIATHFAINLHQKACPAIIMQNVLANFVSLTYTYKESPFTSCKFAPDEWNIYKISDTGFFIFIPKTDTIDITINDKIRIPLFKTYSPLWTKFEYGKDSFELDFANFIQPKLSGDKIPSPKFIDDLTQIFTTDNDLKQNVQFDELRKYLQDEYKDDYSELQKTNWAHLFLTPFNVFVAGHGGVRTQIAGISVENFTEMLAFFNNQINIKTLLISTCSGGGKNLDYLQFRKNLDEEQIPLSLRFTLIMAAITDATTIMSSGKSISYAHEETKTIFIDPSADLESFFNALEGKFISLLDRTGTVLNPEQQQNLSNLLITTDQLITDDQINSIARGLKPSVTNYIREIHQKVLSKKNALIKSLLLKFKYAENKQAQFIKKIKDLIKQTANQTIALNTKIKEALDSPDKIDDIAGNVTETCRKELGTIKTTLASMGDEDIKKILIQVAYFMRKEEIRRLASGVTTNIPEFLSKLINPDRIKEDIFLDLSDTRLFYKIMAIILSEGNKTTRDILLQKISELTFSSETIDLTNFDEARDKFTEYIDNITRKASSLQYNKDEITTFYKKEFMGRYNKDDSLRDFLGSLNEIIDPWRTIQSDKINKIIKEINYFSWYTSEKNHSRDTLLNKKEIPVEIKEVTDQLIAVNNILSSIDKFLSEKSVIRGRTKTTYKIPDPSELKELNDSLKSPLDTLSNTLRDHNENFEGFATKYENRDKALMQIKNTIKYNLRQFILENTESKEFEGLFTTLSSWLKNEGLDIQEEEKITLFKKELKRISDPLHLTQANYIEGVLMFLTLPSNWFYSGFGINSIPQVWIPETGWMQTFDFEPQIQNLNLTSILKSAIQEKNIEVENRLALLIHPQMIPNTIVVKPANLTDQPSWFNEWNLFPSIYFEFYAHKYELKPQSINFLTNKMPPNPPFVYPTIITPGKEFDTYFFSKIIVESYEKDSVKYSGVLNFIRDSFLNLQDRSTTKSFFIGELTGYNDISIILGNKRFCEKGSPGNFDFTTNITPLETDLREYIGQEITLKDVIITTNAVKERNQEYSYKHWKINILFTFKDKHWHFYFNDFIEDTSTPPSKPDKEPKIRRLEFDYHNNQFKFNFWNFKQIDRSDYTEKLQSIAREIPTLLEKFQQTKDALGKTASAFKEQLIFKERLEKFKKTHEGKTPEEFEIKPPVETPTQKLALNLIKLKKTLTILKRKLLSLNKQLTLLKTKLTTKQLDIKSYEIISLNILNKWVREGIKEETLEKDLTDLATNMHKLSLIKKIRLFKILPTRFKQKELESLLTTITKIINSEQFKSKTIEEILTLTQIESSIIKHLQKAESPLFIVIRGLSSIFLNQILDQDDIYNLNESWNNITSKQSEILSLFDKDKLNKILTNLIHFLGNNPLDEFVDKNYQLIRFIDQLSEKSSSSSELITGIKKVYELIKSFPKSNLEDWLKDFDSKFAALPTDTKITIGKIITSKITPDNLKILFADILKVLKITPEKTSVRQKSTFKQLYGLAMMLFSKEVEIPNEQQKKNFHSRLNYEREDINDYSDKKQHYYIYNLCNHFKIVRFMGNEREHKVFVKSALKNININVKNYVQFFENIISGLKNIRLPYHHLETILSELPKDDVGAIKTIFSPTGFGIEGDDEYYDLSNENFTEFFRSLAYFYLFTTFDNKEKDKLNLTWVLENYLKHDKNESNKFWVIIDINKQKTKEKFKELDKKIKEDEDIQKFLKTMRPPEEERDRYNEITGKK